MSRAKIIEDPHTLGVIIEKSVWNKLTGKAKESGMTVTQVVRKALNEFIKEDTIK